MSLLSELENKKFAAKNIKANIIDCKIKVKRLVAFGLVLYDNQ